MATALGIAGVGTVLAVVGVSGTVSDFQEWVEAGEWVPLAVTSALMVAVLLVVPVLLRLGRK